MGGIRIQFRGSWINGSYKDLVQGSAQDPDPLDPQDFGFLDPDPRGKISIKNCKKTFFTPKTKI